MKSLIELDGKLLVKIQQSTKHEYLDKFFPRYTRAGDTGGIWVLLAIIFLAIDGTRETGVVIFFALTATWLINTIGLKSFLKRVRPYEAVENIRLLVKAQRDTSFPSGHAASSFAAAVVVVIMYGGYLGIICLVLAALMAFSRVYVGVHYPLDVIVGSLVGSLIGYLSVVLFAM